MRFVVLTIVILTISCTGDKRIKVTGYDMQNTILYGAQVTISNSPAQKSSIVAIRTGNEDKIKILRVIGIPGDNVEIIDGEYFVNGKKENKIPSSKKVYTIYLKDPEGFKLLSSYPFEPYSKNYSFVSLSMKEVEDIRNKKLADSIFTVPVDPNQVQNGVISYPGFKYANIYYFGPLRIPLPADRVNSEIITVAPLYYSQKDLGKKVTRKLYFCVGDNFPESKDSRFSGLFAEEDFVGIVEKIKNPTLVKVQK